MLVLNHWCACCTGNNFNSGHIAGLDFSDENDRYFQLEVDDEQGAYYNMRYDAILHYADEDQSIFSRFRLPSKAYVEPTVLEAASAP